MPWQCFTCQMIKLGNGIYSGRYSKSTTNKQGDDPYSGQEGITPASFKSLIGKDHPEFLSMKQQDALEFFEYLVKFVEQKEKFSTEDPVEEFRFRLHQKIQCQSCGGVHRSSFMTSSLSIPLPRCKDTLQESNSLENGETRNVPTISLKDCFDEFFQDEEVDFRCPSCKKQTKAKKYV